MPRARLTALAVIVILACPPAVIGACAAWLCAPGAGHDSHVSQVAAASSHHDHHAHHGVQAEHQAHHAPAPAASSALGTIPSPDCCTAVGARAIAAAVTSSSRLDSNVRHASNAVFVAAVLYPDRIPVLLSDASPPERFSSPPQPVAAPLVLRI